MKRLFLFFLAIVAVVAVKAQQIAVVSTDGSTSVHNTLQKAIEAATEGCVIYLPGGGFPIPDSVKIKNKVTIIGIGHKVKTENTDGYTTIQGNLFFDNGSSGSAVLGAYITGAVFVGNDGSEVDDVLVRYCNLDRVEVKNKTCLGTVVNQNYIRNKSSFSGASAAFTNNICHSINDLDNGVIENNIIVYSFAIDWDGVRAIRRTDNTSIKNNILMDWRSGPHDGNNCLVSGNMAMGNWGDDPINVTGVAWTDIFVNHAGITPASDYHFKGQYQKYNNVCGIYAGTGFSDTALPPVPYIVSKQIPEQTDGNGNLNIKIRVRAGE